MINRPSKYQAITCLMALTVGLNTATAAVFVVQTNLDTGGGMTIAEISPNVFTIDTLRSAIEQANNETNFPGPDTIRFDENIPGVISTTITLSQAGDQFNFQSQSSDSAFGIDSAITIQGRLPGEAGNDITLNADGLRHFQVNNGGKLRLYNLSLSNGETPQTTAGRGGVVVVDNIGLLEINDCRFNLSEAVNGGALAFQQGALDALIQNATFYFNDASDNNRGTDYLGLGGAIFADTSNNSIIIENSEFIGNFADAHGGALYINRPFEIINSTFHANDAQLDGGAIYMDEQGPFTISNSLFYNNESELLGGALFNAATGLNAGKIYNSTFTLNIAGWGLSSRQTRGQNTTGGAIYSNIADNLLIHNCIVAENLDVNDADDISADLSSGSSHNIIGVKGGVTGIFHNINGNLVGTALQPIDAGIKLNSQLTPTGLNYDSPAINSGSDAQVFVAGLSTDIDGNDRVIGAAVDRGAHETDVLFYNGFE